MQELRFLNYYTIYSYSRIDARGQKHQIFDRHRAICFRELFSTFSDTCTKGEYTVFVSKDLNTLNSHHCNYCFLNKRGIVDHVKRLQQVVPEVESFSVVPVVYNEFTGYEVTIIINKAPRIVHAYALTWLRYLYETVFSLALLDVTRLTKLPEFRFVSYENLLNVVQACFDPSYPKFNTWHALGMMQASEFLTKKELKEAIPKSDTLNSLYNVKGGLAYEMLPPLNEKLDLEFWESEEKFQNLRLPKYIKLFRILKS